MKFVNLNKYFKKVIVISGCSAICYSCIKPYACECTYIYTEPQQKSHILVYSTKQNRQNACDKNNRDTSFVCKIKE